MPAELIEMKILSLKLKNAMDDFDRKFDKVEDLIKKIDQRKLSRVPEAQWRDEIYRYFPKMPITDSLLIC